MIKNRNDVRNCYLIMGFSFMIPLFDFHHFSIYIVCFILQILDFIPIRQNYYYSLMGFLSVLFSVLLFIAYYNLLKPVWATDILGFQYTLCAGEEYQKSVKYFDLFDQYDNKLILSPNAMQYKTSRGEDITYFDLLINGNHGYRGNQKMIKKMEKMHNVYIIVNLVFYYDDNPYNQFNKTIVKYVMDSYKKVDSYEDFAIYYKN